MPIVRLEILKGASRNEKAEIVWCFTDALVEILKKKPEHIHVVISEVDDENWGYSGILTDEFKRSER